MDYNINGKILPSQIDINNCYKISHNYGNITSLNGKFTLDRNGSVINFIPKSIAFNYNCIDVDFGSFVILSSDVIYYSFGYYGYSKKSLYKISDFSAKIFISKSCDFSGNVVIEGGIHPPNVIVKSDDIEFNVFYPEQNPVLYWERPYQEISEIVGYFYSLNHNPNYVVFTNDNFINSDSVLLNIETSGILYFHIRAINSFGNMSKQTTTVCIKYNHIPTVPLNLKVNGYSSYTGSTSLNTLSWDESIDSDSDTFQYFIELYHNDESDSSLIYSSYLSDNRLVFPLNESEFFNAGKYCFRVRSEDEFESSAWSDFCLFNIISLKNDAFSGEVYAAHVPPAPTITCNVESDVWTTYNEIYFSWTAENDRVTIGKYIYKFELYKYFEDDALGLEDVDVYDYGENLNTSKYYNLNYLNGSCVYRLSVRAQGKKKNEVSVTGLISEPSYYYIKYNHAPSIPSIPLLVNDINSVSKTGYVGENYNNIFKWNRSEDLDDDIIYYEIQVSKDIYFNNIFYSRSYITDDKRANYSFHNGAIGYENSNPRSFGSYDEIRSVINWEVGPTIDSNDYPINAEYSSDTKLNIRKFGYLYIDTPGEYSFGIWCDDMAAFRVDNKTYFTTITPTWEVVYCFTLFLSKGYHYIENYCNNNGGGNGYSRLYWRTPQNDNWNYIPKSVVFYCVDDNGNFIDETNIYKYIYYLADESDSFSNSESQSEHILSENYEFLMNIDYDNSYNGLYYWRVRAYDRKEYSGWSHTGKFKLNTPPSVPTNLSITY